MPGLPHAARLHGARSDREMSARLSSTSCLNTRIQSIRNTASDHGLQAPDPVARCRRRCADVAGSAADHRAGFPSRPGMVDGAVPGFRAHRRRPRHSPLTRTRFPNTLQDLAGIDVAIEPCAPGSPLEQGCAAEVAGDLQQQIMTDLPDSVRMERPVYFHAATVYKIPVNQPSSRACAAKPQDGRLRSPPLPPT